MNNSHYRNALIAAGIAATLGVGVAGCSEADEERAVETSRESTATADSQYTSDRDYDTSETVSDAGEEAARAVSDTWVTAKVKSALLADTDAKGLDVNVDTKDGVVTLEGELASQTDVDHVEALARDVEGVERVNATALTVASRTSTP